MAKTKDEKELQKAVVLTAVRLTKLELSEISEAINKISNQQFNLLNRIDKTIIGGMLIHFADRIIDLTLRTRVEKLKEKLRS